MLQLPDHHSLLSSAQRHNALMQGLGCFIGAQVVCFQCTCLFYSFGRKYKRFGKDSAVLGTHGGSQYTG